MEKAAEMDDLMRDLAVEITHVYRRLAEQVGINHTDLMCLYFVRSLDGQATPKSVSQHLGLTSGATAIMLNRLEAAGLIARHPHPTDRRGVLLSLGDAARQTGVLRLRDHIRQMNKDVVASYSEAELRIVRRFITDVLANTRDALVKARSEPDGVLSLTGKADQPTP